MPFHDCNPWIVSNPNSSCWWWTPFSHSATHCERIHSTQWEINTGQLHYPKQWKQTFKIHPLIRIKTALVIKGEIETVSDLSVAVGPWFNYIDISDQWRFTIGLWPVDSEATAGHITALNYTINVHQRNVSFLFYEPQIKTIWSYKVNIYLDIYRMNFYIEHCFKKINGSHQII